MPGLHCLPGLSCCKCYLNGHMSQGHCKWFLVVNTCGDKNRCPSTTKICNFSNRPGSAKNVQHTALEFFNQEINSLIIFT